MKTTLKSLLQITALGLAALACSETAAAPRSLILLHENSGATPLDGILDGPAAQAARTLIDRAAESEQAAQFALMASGKYQRFINLSDRDCTRQNLLNALIQETVAGREIDLAILGHGFPERLVLHGEELTGTRVGRPGNIRSLLSDARALRGTSFNFNLRLVRMGNCFASTLNDDWRAIGARVSIGALATSYMPGTMTAQFWQEFVHDDKRVIQAADDAWSTSCAIWRGVPGYTDVDPQTGRTKLADSRPIVSGYVHLIFKDECQLALNESRTVTVRADQPYSFLASI